MNIPLIEATQNPLVVSTGLIGYWSCNDGAGSIARDFCGNINHTDAVLSTNPPTWSVGKIGNCLNFNGNGPDNYVYIPDSSYLLPLNNDFSMAYWFNSPVQPDIVSMVGKRQNNPPFVQFDSGIGFVDGGGSGHATSNFYFFQYDGVGPLSGIHTNNTFTDAMWHHAVVLRPGSGAPSIYIDGVNQAYTIDSTTFISNINNPGIPWQFGNSSQGIGGFYFSGSITLTAGTGSIDFIGFVYDGTTLFANVGNNFN